MRKKRAKFLYNLIVKQDPTILIQIRNLVGPRTSKMDKGSLYRTVKRMWAKNILNRKEILKCQK